MGTSLTQAAKPETTPEYWRTGIVFDAVGHELTIDLSQARTVRVTGINARTGEAKDYLLKVTQSGKLLLL